MSDSYRKDFSDKAAEAVKPDSQKGYVEKGKEFVTDKADQVAGKAQPESEKGVFQGVSDSAHKGKEAVSYTHLDVYKRQALHCDVDSW